MDPIVPDGAGTATFFGSRSIPKARWEKMKKGKGRFVPALSLFWCASQQASTVFTAVFIDGAYLEKVLQHEHSRARVDFRLLVDAMVGDDVLLRTYYYNCRPYQSNPPTEDERARYSSWRRFEDALRNIPNFDVRLGKLVLRGTDSDGKRIFQQKGVDLMLGVDMALLAAKNRLAKVVLLSGDSDFVPAIEAVKREGILTTLWHGRDRRDSSASRELRQTCDQRQVLTREIVQSSLLRL